MKSLILGVVFLVGAGFVVYENVAHLTPSILAFAGGLVLLAGLLIDTEPMKSALAEAITFGRSAKDVVEK